MSALKWPSEKYSPDVMLKFAREAADNAYAPYSKFHVGAAMLLKDGEIISACNVENASYSLTICAERSAVVMMIAQRKNDPVVIAVAGSHENSDDYFKIPCPPCGACLQTLAEFNENMLIVLASKGTAKIYELKEFLPYAFTLETD